MKNPAAVPLGKKRGAQLKKVLGKKGLRDHKQQLAYKRHGRLDKVVK